MSRWAWWAGQQPIWLSAPNGLLNRSQAHEPIRALENEPRWALCSRLEPTRVRHELYTELIRAQLASRVSRPSSTLTQAKPSSMVVTGVKQIPWPLRVQHNSRWWGWYNNVINDGWTWYIPRRNRKTLVDAKVETNAKPKDDSTEDSRGKKDKSILNLKWQVNSNEVQQSQNDHNGKSTSEFPMYAI